MPAVKYHVSAFKDFGMILKSAVRICNTYKYTYNPLLLYLTVVILRVVPPFRLVRD